MITKTKDEMLINALAQQPPEVLAKMVIDSQMKYAELLQRHYRSITTSREILTTLMEDMINPQTYANPMTIMEAGVN